MSVDTGWALNSKTCSIAMSAVAERPVVAAPKMQSARPIAWSSSRCTGWQRSDRALARVTAWLPSGYIGHRTSDIRHQTSAQAGLAEAHGKAAATGAAAICDTILVTLPSALPFPTHHRPQCPSIGRCFPTWHGREVIGWRADSSSDGRSGLPWCVA